MKLYELPRGTWFKIAVDDYLTGVFFLDHIDGAYSVCRNKQGEIIHISASVNVGIIT